MSDFLYDPSGGLSSAGRRRLWLVGCSASTGRMRGRTTRSRPGRKPCHASRGRAASPLGVLVAGAASWPAALGHGTFLSQILDLAGHLPADGLGLNIVVGYAGLLDLGYVAFFAVGAYSTAIFTSPHEPGFTPG